MNLPWTMTMQLIIHKKNLVSILSHTEQFFIFIHNTVFRMAFSPFIVKDNGFSGQERNTKIIQHLTSNTI